MQIGVPDVSLLTFTFSPAWIARYLRTSHACGSSRFLGDKHDETATAFLEGEPAGEVYRRNGETVISVYLKTSSLRLH